MSFLAPNQCSRPPPLIFTQDQRHLLVSFLLFLDKRIPFLIFHVYEHAYLSNSCKRISNSISSSSSNNPNDAAEVSLHSLRTEGIHLPREKPGSLLKHFRKMVCSAI